MSIIKSSVLNLYDGLSGNHHFQSKVSSDRIQIQSTTLPIFMKGTQIILQNENGNVVHDIVETILDDKQALAAEIVARESAISNEIIARENADGLLQTAIDQETMDRGTAMDNERTDRVAAEEALGKKITAEEGARKEQMRLEVIDRAAADAGVQSNLDAAVVLLNTADSTLQTNIDTEEQERKNAITAVETKHNDDKKELEGKITDESTARGDADTKLTLDLNKEILDRGTAVSSERDARTDADSVLSGLVNTERSERKAEVLIERNRIDAILEGSSLDLNQLKELVDAYTTSDSNILQQIANINTTITAIQAQLDGTDTQLNTLLANIETPVVDYGDNTHRVHFLQGEGGVAGKLTDLSGTELYETAGMGFDHLMGDVLYSTFDGKQLFINGVEWNFSTHTNGIFLKLADGSSTTWSEAGFSVGQLIKFV